MDLLLSDALSGRISIRAIYYQDVSQLMLLTVAALRISGAATTLSSKLGGNIDPIISLETNAGN